MINKEHFRSRGVKSNKSYLTPINSRFSIMFEIICQFDLFEPITLTKTGLNNGVNVIDIEL